MSDAPTGTPFHCPKPDQHDPHAWDPDHFGDAGPYWCNGEETAP